MFKEYEETRAIWFSEESFEEGYMYHLIGMKTFMFLRMFPQLTVPGILCGLAIYNFTIINIPFPLALYKKLLKEPVGLNDLKGLSPSLANSLKSLLDYEEPNFTDVFGLDFEIVREVYGEQRVIPLKPNGNSVPVTLENK